MSLFHKQVYEELLKLSKRSSATGVKPSDFVLQKDAFQRLSDDDAQEEPFASYTYDAIVDDRSLPFALLLFRKFFVFHIGEVSREVDYEKVGSPKEVAQSIIITIQMLLNGQLRDVVTISGGRIKAIEAFIIDEKNNTKIIGFIAKFGLFHRNLETKVFKNSILKQKVKVPKDFYLINKEIEKTYKHLGRKINWAEPQPLTKKEWNKIVEDATWRNTGKKPLKSPYIYALKQWETWAFTAVFGAVFVILGIIIGKNSSAAASIRLLSQISYVIFVYYFLPPYLRKKYDRQQAATTASKKDKR